MKRTPHLTPGEFELMEILWRLGEGSVRAVRQRMDPQRPLAYTTIMTVLNKLRRKGILKQSKKGKAYYYSPAIRREEALACVVEHVVANYFNGSRADFLHYLSNGAKTPEPPGDHVGASPGQNEGPQIEEFLL